MPIVRGVIDERAGPQYLAFLFRDSQDKEESIHS